MAVYPNDPIRIKIARNQFGEGYMVAIIGERSAKDRSLSVAEPIEMKYIKEGGLIKPALDISFQAAQELIDNLWDCGLRPSEGSGSAGAMLATQRHLQDMRSLVEKFTKVKFWQNAG